MANDSRIPIPSCDEVVGAACAQVLLKGETPLRGSAEIYLQRKNLVYAIETHLDACGQTLGPLTRALLAASRDALGAAEQSRVDECGLAR